MFYIRERGRFFPDDSQDKGRLLSAGYHNVMGYLRDDTPLMELILDEKGKKRARPALGRVRLHRRPHGAHLGSVFLQPERRSAGHGRESGQRAAPDKDVSAPPVIFGLRDAYLAKAEASDNPIADGGHPVPLPVGERHAAVGGADARRMPSPSIWTRC